MGPPRQQIPTIENNQPLNDEALSLDTIDGCPQPFNNGGIQLRNQPPSNIVANVNNSSNQVIESTPQVLAQIVVNELEIDNIPVPEELQNMSRNSNVEKLVEHLRCIADKLEKDHYLSHLISKIDVKYENFNIIFEEIASGLLVDGISWERIALLFYLAARLAIRVINQLPLVEKIFDCFKMFVAKKLVKWITDSGGWIAVQEYAKNRQCIALAFFIISCALIYNNL